MNLGTQLLEETRELLNARPATVSMAQIARELGVSTGWLTLVANGHATNPGIATVGELNTYLKGVRNA